MMVLPSSRWAAAGGVLLLALASTARAFTSRVRVVPRMTSTVLPTSMSSILQTDVPIKPDDNRATGFSLQTAYFLAKMSHLAFEEKADAETAVKDRLGYPYFQWFEFLPSVANDKIFDAIEDTQGFIAANDDVIVLAFRGTSGLSDVATDIKVNPVPAPSAWGVEGSVHQGFYQGVESVWKRKEVGDTLRKLYNEPRKGRRLFVTGHSLGGALAVVAAGYLAFEEKMDVHGVYTTGCPRVFDEELARVFDQTNNGNQKLRSKCFRLRNHNDVVTRLLASLYRHVGEEIYFDRRGIISTSSLRDRLLGRLDALLNGNFLDGVDDHGIDIYTMLLQNAINVAGQSTVEKLSEMVSKSISR